MLHQFPHPLHGFDHGLRPGSLFFHRRIDFVRNLVQPGGGARDLLDSMDRFALEQIERALARREEKAGVKGGARQAAAGTRS